MGRRFRIDRCPLDEDVRLYEKGTVTFEEGITVLVGCNGSGKTTLLKIIENRLKKDNIPCMRLNTLSDAANMTGNAMFDQNFSLAAFSLSAAEGERMMACIGRFASTVRRFIATGKGRKNRFDGIFGNEEKEITSKERWLLIDSADSGLSIDALAEVNDFLHLVEEDAEKSGYAVYIVVSTNQYELTVGNRCLNVQTLKPVSVKSYNGYRNIVMKSRERKDARQED